MSTLNLQPGQVTVARLGDGRICCYGLCGPHDPLDHHRAMVGVPTWDHVRAQVAVMDPRVVELKPGEMVTIDLNNTSP